MIPFAGIVPISVDDGSIYIVGEGHSDLFVAKWDTHGIQLWNRTWGGSSSDTGTGIAIDNDGSITDYHWNFGEEYVWVADTENNKGTGGNRADNGSARYDSRLCGFAGGGSLGGPGKYGVELVFRASDIAFLFDASIITALGFSFFS